IWILEDDLDVARDLTITSGTLDVDAAENNSINIMGSWTNSGTFFARNGLVTFDNNTPNSRTITSGGSAFYNLTFSPSTSTTDQLSAYTLEDTLDVDNNLTIDGVTLDTNSAGNHAINVAGDWTNLEATNEQAKTLRPESDVGGHIDLNPKLGSENNYEVDEETADDNTTYVSRINDTSWKYDYYGMPNPTGNCRNYSIKHVKIYFRHNGGEWNQFWNGGSIRPVISNGADYSSTGHGDDVALTVPW
ncbi:unnamed protein product, partial [marine sediment metagenome]